jgi:hypothetical protein
VSDLLRRLRVLRDHAVVYDVADVLAAYRVALREERAAHAAALAALAAERDAARAALDALCARAGQPDVAHLTAVLEGLLDAHERRQRAAARRKPRRYRRSPHADPAP